MNRWSPALLAGLMLAAAAQDAGAADGLPFTMKVDRLPNGLQVVTAHTDTPGIISYFTIVRTGSRDEVEKGRSGYAHFFEHMMFRGTKQWSSQAYSAKLQAHGADGNAYTTWDYTAYHVTAPKAALADVITLESDRFRYLDYDEAAYRTEAGAVLGEYNLSFSDPGMKAWEVLGETAFTTHTYGHTTIGYGADVKAMPEGFEYARAFFKRHYTPDNTTIIVAGDVEPAEVLAAITKAYGDWTGTHDAPVVPAEPEQTEPRTGKVEWPASTAPRVLVSWKVAGWQANTVDSAAFEVAAEMLVGETSPLYRRLVLDEQRVQSLEHSGYYAQRDPHLWVIELRLADAADADKVVEALQTAATEMAAAVDAERVAAAKSHLRGVRLLRLETPERIAGFLADRIGLTGDPEAAAKSLTRLAEVTPDDVRRVVGAWLTPARRTVVTLTGAAAKEEVKP